MITDHTPESLIEFEAGVAEAFNAGKIRAPIHLSGGNEAALIEIFRAVQPQDWVLTTWRSHYHCLLKGVPEIQLKTDIIQGRSITLTYQTRRIVSSAIVGGMLPVAVGLAWSIKAAREIRWSGPAGVPYVPNAEPKVWVFVGDMAAETGAFSECTRYARAHNLPVRFVVEDNGISVCTDTQKAWGSGTRIPEPYWVTRYVYKLPWPHSGAGKRINF